MYYTTSAVNNKGAQQTVWMRRLICAFIVRTWHRTNFLMKWLVLDMQTPIINKHFIKNFATVNKSTKIKHIAAIRQMLHIDVDDILSKGSSNVICYWSRLCRGLNLEKKI